MVEFWSYASSGLQINFYFVVASCDKEQGALWGPSHKGINPFHDDSTFMT